MVYMDKELSYNIICDLKKIALTENSHKLYDKAISSIYHAVCLDIDDTITYSSLREKELIVNALAKLVERNVIICFITGRGISNALDFLNDLKSYITNANPSIRQSQFSRWYCITNNGHMLYYTDVIGPSVFMGKGINLVSSELRTEYLRIKPRLQERILVYLSERLSTSYNNLKDYSTRGSSEYILRFPVDSPDFKSVDRSLLDGINSIVSELTSNTYGISKGYYHKEGKIVIEVSMTTKGAAINAVGKYLGILQNKILRIGDQGDLTGNDFELLNCICGFSVDTYSNSANGCWPIIGKDEEGGIYTMKGVAGTSLLLSSLLIFPSMCLEMPNKAMYLPKLAKSEQANLKENRFNHYYYEQKLRRGFHQADYFADDGREIIDRRTGGYIIFDWEYELLRVTNPNHMLFRIYSERRLFRKPEQKELMRTFPLLKFAMHTDLGILLRGPLNYYYGLAYRNSDNSNLRRGFAITNVNHKLQFLKMSIRAISEESFIDMKDSITRRILLGIMDTVRDCLLTLINIHLQEKAGDSDKLVLFSSNDSELYKLFEVAKTNLVYMYQCLFENCDIKFPERLLAFLNNTIYPLVVENKAYIESLPNDFDYKKACRVWREIDSFYENVIAIDTALEKLYADVDISNKELVFLGIRYGSLELSIIASMLVDVKFKYLNVEYLVGSMCLKSDYHDNHTKMLDDDRKLSSIINQHPQSKNERLHILMDDNLVTGRTIKIANNMLVKDGIYPNKVFVVRYPAVNRIEQMYLKNQK